MLFILGAQKSIFNPFLLLASVVFAQETITADPCSTARSVDSSCVAKYGVNRSNPGLDVSVASPTYHDVDLVRCFCCLGEAPMTPVWSSCAAQIGTKTAMSSEKELFNSIFTGCAGFEACRVETATPAACNVISSRVASCSKFALTQGTARIPADERYSRMEDCVCPGSSPYEFNDALNACHDWAILHKPELVTDLSAFLPFACYDEPTTTFSATATSTALWTTEETGTSSFASTTAASTPVSSAGSAIPSNTAPKDRTSTMAPSRVPAATLDDVPDIADTCKLIVARYSTIVAHQRHGGPHAVTREVEKSIDWAINETANTIPRIESVIRTIQAGADRRRQKLPDISYVLWTRSLQNAKKDPLGPESRVPDEVLIEDIPRLADRFRAVAVRFEELERDPYVRGDDILKSYDRVNVVLMECQRVKKYLTEALDDVLFALTGKDSEMEESLSDSCSSEESNGSQDADDTAEKPEAKDDLVENGTVKRPVFGEVSSRGTDGIQEDNESL
ncbi:hypothetical protein CkaCkLH20_00863 [Colletotrichum karsti]|uniref:Uncharacterized protein n=1 Tax=Colletotrichum karsti TaxID=1095194 RepID=A0A9P6LR25_9PEZI|nr:uncharacterized protein CkaCkLH20_00863 [Colletotrichum karsti]KAF9881717.1 hypothetical protein CkaCkLH20_00863 [Colletotrichum karsti]